MAHGSKSAWLLLEGRHEAWLSRPRLLDLPQIRADGPRQSRVALWPILRVKDGVVEEGGYLPPRHPRERHPVGSHDQTCSHRWRLGRILSQPRAQTVDADRRKRAGIRQAQIGRA